MNLTYQEKTLYAQLLGVVALVIFYAHFLSVAPPGTRPLHGFILALLLILTSYRTFLRRKSGDILTDERDRTIDAIGARWSNIILFVGIVAIELMFWDHGKLQSSRHIVDLLFHLLVLAGVVRIVRQIVAYRTSL